MPPLPSQKGTGKKGRDVRQSRSRNTTPSLAGSVSSMLQSESGYTPYLQLPLEKFRTADDLSETYGTTIPSSKDLEALLERLNKLIAVVDERGTICDKGMRKLADKRKDRLEEIENDRRDEERLKQDVANEEERGRSKSNKTKRKKDMTAPSQERPLTHGAHGLAPQDGSNLGNEYVTTVTFTITNIIGRALIARTGKAKDVSR